jgi:hypothetical protein
MLTLKSAFKALDTIFNKLVFPEQVGPTIASPLNLLK